MDYFFHQIGNVIIPTDFHSIIFQRGWNQPPTRIYSTMMYLTSNFNMDFPWCTLTIHVLKHDVCLCNIESWDVAAEMSELFHVNLPFWILGNLPSVGELGGFLREKWVENHPIVGDNPSFNRFSVNSKIQTTQLSLPRCWRCPWSRMSRIFHASPENDSWNLEIRGLTPTHGAGDFGDCWYAAPTMILVCSEKRFWTQKTTETQHGIPKGRICSWKTMTG